MHLAPMMTIPYIPSANPTKPPNSKPGQKQETPTSVPAPRLVPGERRVRPRLSKPSLDPVLESDKRLSRDAEHMIYEDVSRVTRKHSLPTLPRKGSDFFEEVFGSRKTDEPGDQIRNESVVLTEIKTNVIIEDEFTFITELSEYLSLRYNRPSSSIVTTVQHGICIRFGGSGDPCYTMKIEALARDLQPATNKRNMALFQMHMEQALRIPPSRGFLKFVPLAEDYTGWKGNTVAGEVAKAMEQAQSVTERRGSIRAPKRRSSKVSQQLTDTIQKTWELGSDRVEFRHFET
ncbi:macrophage migration inhibitory factor [Fusarium austroafricanum]|uniref:L-dopachrome isomerase n=1 Tax=Fusarium austroafricanum TaxID=2364996 RepID=A0A8H4NNC3_9HYPO|nr:macrophage migration inhibitory factor [Fusarium austroafricanum]